MEAEMRAAPGPAGAGTTLGPLRRRVLLVAGAVALVGLGVSAAVAAGAGEQGVQRLLFAYLASYAFYLSLALGGLFFVLIQHVSRAGWSVTVRRMAELVAMLLPLLAVLALPVVWGLWRSGMYHWVHATDPIIAGKQAYLNAPFFVARLALYFGLWSAVAWWYWRQSLSQDAGGETARTSSMQRLSAPALVLFGVSVTFAAFDLLMSLNPHWYSTMFGVYFFAGAVVGSLAAQILLTAGLQRAGRLTSAVSVEHYHDLGKLLFAFVFFWGYIAFSQYMLIWYANLPEETVWLADRGANATEPNAYSVLVLALLFGHLLLPFAALLSRWAKRRRSWLVGLAAWLLVMHWLDLVWVVRPELRADGVGLPLDAVDMACLSGTLVGLGGLAVAFIAWLAGQRSLVPAGDPRLHESLAFHQPM